MQRFPNSCLNSAIRTLLLFFGIDETEVRIGTIFRENIGDLSIYDAKKILKFFKLDFVEINICCKSIEFNNNGYYLLIMNTSYIKWKPLFYRKISKKLPDPIWHALLIVKLDHKLYAIDSSWFYGGKYDLNQYDIINPKINGIYPEIIFIPL